MNGMNPILAGLFGSMGIPFPTGPVYKKQIFFQNGFGISVVSGQGTYGGDEGLFEAALLHSSTEDVIYAEDFQDVRKNLDFEDVVALKVEVSAYPANKAIGGMGGPYFPPVKIDLIEDKSEAHE